MYTQTTLGLNTMQGSKVMSYSRRQQHGWNSETFSRVKEVRHQSKHGRSGPCLGSSRTGRANLQWDKADLRLPGKEPEGVLSRWECGLHGYIRHRNAVDGLDVNCASMKFVVPSRGKREEVSGCRLIGSPYQPRWWMLSVESLSRTPATNTITLDID